MGDLQTQRHHGQAWCEANPKEAKAAFATSAVEVIEKLQEIDRALRG
jgi:hypothetical protein